MIKLTNEEYEAIMEAREASNDIYAMVDEDCDIELTENEYKAIMEAREESFINESYKDAVMEGVLTINEASFSFLPKFSKSKELSKYQKVAKEAEEILNDKGEPSDTKIHKAASLVLRILDIIWNFGSIFTLIGCVTIVGIIPHLIQRICIWIVQTGEESIADAEGNKIISKLDKIIEKEEDPEKKKKYEEVRDKVKKSISKLN